MSFWQQITMLTIFQRENTVLKGLEKLLLTHQKMWSCKLISFGSILRFWRWILWLFNKIVWHVCEESKVCFDYNCIWIVEEAIFYYFIAVFNFVFYNKFLLEFCGEPVPVVSFLLDLCYLISFVIFLLWDSNFVFGCLILIFNVFHLFSMIFFLLILRFNRLVKLLVVGLVIGYWFVPLL